ncbi:DinB family protein [Alkalihalobacillus pseudalcaliphilus]|uniref:DinB family protein n=1 Tax=Alkalihalobacillus pseudalcaliphilus TaxID=79884 RepID=UPI000A9025E2|nr:DinB family protein [Alkalihalobacillus pseudalcaliphilus]
MYLTAQKLTFGTPIYADIVNHVIAHEFHHIVQLSVWTREIGLTLYYVEMIKNL